MILDARSALGAPFAVPAAISGLDASDLTLLERSDIGCLLVNSADDIAEILRPLELAAGFALPREGGRAVHSIPYRAIWLTPRSWLIQCPLEDEARLAERINGAFIDKQVHAALFTDSLAWLDLSGKRSSTLLSEGGFVSLENGGLAVGHAKRTLLAGVAVVVIRLETDAWLLGVERSRARYFADWLCSVANRPIFSEQVSEFF